MLCRCGEPAQPASLDRTATATVQNPSRRAPAPRPATGQTRPDPGNICAAFGAAATIDATRSTLGQTWQAAARRCGGPNLLALYSDGGQGRDPQQELWQLHQTQVRATATSTQDARGAHAPAVPNLPSESTEQIEVRISGTARGGGGSAPPAGYRAECLLSADPVRGWLAEDIATEPVTFPAAPSTSGSR